MPYITPSVQPSVVNCGRFFIPDDLRIRAALLGQIYELCEYWNWEQTDGITVQATVDLMNELYDTIRLDTACMIGVIVPITTENIPNNMLEANGQSFARVDYPELYAAIANSLKIDADNATVPDLRELFVLASATPHNTGGEATHTLITDELPAHTHTTQPHTHTTQPHTHSETGAAPVIINGGIEAPANSAVPTAIVTGAAIVTVDSAGVTVDSTGGGNPHNNMPPYYTLRYAVVAR